MPIAIGDEITYKGQKMNVTEIWNDCVILCDNGSIIRKSDVNLITDFKAKPHQPTEQEKVEILSDYNK